MTALQYKMLELVLEIDDICRKNNIVYYLAGGSVLGAVRHKGFIPWDDDIDIMMTRQEFAKFQDACQTDMRSDREIITMMNTPCHTKVTIKYMNKATSQFFRSQVLDTTGCGISLDIMILDPLPKDEKEKEQHIAEYIVYNELLTPFFMVNKNLYKCVPLYNKYARQAKVLGKKRVMDKLYRRLFVDEPKESELYLYRWGQQLLIYEHRLFGKPRYVAFEGHMLPIPEQAMEFLRVTYGDNWIYLPPEAQRETHVSWVNPNIAYCNWLKDIRPFLDRESVLQDFTARKKGNVKKAVPAHEKNVWIYRQTALMTELEFQDKRCAYDILAGMDDTTLLEHVGEYLKRQLDGEWVKNQIYADIPDETLALILNALVRTGAFPKADKILKLRKTVSRALTEELKEVQLQIDAVRRMVRYFEDRRFDAEAVAEIGAVMPELFRLREAYPQQLNLLRCELELYTLVDGYSNEEVMSAIDRAKAGYPEDTEIAFWAGCLYRQMGMEAAAAEQLMAALYTDNGVILQRLEEMGIHMLEETDEEENDGCTEEVI